MTWSGGGAPQRRLVLRRVGVADERRVVPPDERAVERRADARIGLRADDDESPDSEAREHASRGWCPRRSRRSSSRRAARPRPESARGRSASRRSRSQAARRSAGPRQRGLAPAAPSRRGCRRSRRPRRAREPPRRRRSARRRRGVRCSAGSRVWSWSLSQTTRRTAKSYELREARLPAARRRRAPAVQPRHHRRSARGPAARDGDPHAARSPVELATTDLRERSLRSGQPIGHAFAAPVAAALRASGHGSSTETAGDTARRRTASHTGTPHHEDPSETTPSVVEVEAAQSTRLAGKHSDAVPAVAVRVARREAAGSEVCVELVQRPHVVIQDRVVDLPGAHDLGVGGQ